VNLSADIRLRDLRRMRFLATALLALMSAIFAATHLTRLEWLAYLRAFAEAGMIGACAVGGRTALSSGTA
jgi:uncharacterized membrane-anchored protein YjiN (DUF445 family)